MFTVISVVCSFESMRTPSFILIGLLTLGTHARGLRYLACVCVCVSVCLFVRHHESCYYAQWSVQPKVHTASVQSGKHFKHGAFSKNASFKSYGVKKANKLSMCLP